MTEFVDQTNHLLLAVSALALIALVLGGLSARVGISFLLVFLVVGMLAGEDGPGGIQFDDHRLSFVVGNLALAIILLDGGLRTRVASFRVALKPALLLATIGVLLTAIGVAGAAMLLLALDWRTALLLGAIVGSTDAAAVFALLKSSGLRLNERVANALEVESGINDPMAVFLVVGLIGLIVAAPAAEVDGLAAAGAAGKALGLGMFQQFGLGLAAGGLLGYLLSELMLRLRLGDGLNALLVSAGGVAVFACTNALGGSGFLAVYLAGLVAGNRRRHASDGVMRAMDGMAWLAQAGMFLLLGLLVTPADVLTVALPALGVAAVLMLVARPLATWLCLAPLGFAGREIAFMGWVGLRGAVPIVLAIFPLLAGVPHAKLLFNVAFVVVLASLVLQGTTIALAARRAGVTLAPRAEPEHRMPLASASDALEAVQYLLPAQHPWQGVSPQQLELPAAARLVAVVRGDDAQPTSQAPPLQAGDRLVFLARESGLERLGELMCEGQPAPRPAAPALRFVVAADARLGDVLALYAPAVAVEAGSALTVAESVGAHMSAPVEGDAVQLHGLRWTIAEMDGGRIRKVALEVPVRIAAPPQADS
jgi:cell volume regulation protein A